MPVFEVTMGRVLPRAAANLAVLVVISAPWIAPQANASIDRRAKPSDGNLWGTERFQGGRQIRGDCARRPCIALTFDDGPDYNTTPRVLDELDRHNVRATFFVTGHRMDGNGNVARMNRDTLRDTWRRGHLIGNHTYHHDVLDTMEDATLDDEIDRTAELIERTIGHRTFLFRAPFGALSQPRALHAVYSRGLTPVFWAVDTRDWASHSPEEILDNFRAGLDKVPHGGVVLFHDTLALTAQALPLAFAEIEARNQARRAAGQPIYEFVGLDELWRPLHRQ